MSDFKGNVLPIGFIISESIRNLEKCRIGLDSRLRGNDERGGNDGSYKKKEARLAELVDAHDLGSCLF